MDLLTFDKGGFAYTNPLMLSKAFDHDVHALESKVVAIVYKPINKAVLANKPVLPA